MRTGRLIAIAGLALFGICNQASAAVFFDTTAGLPFGTPTSAWSVANAPGIHQSVGIEFTLSSATTITSVDAYIFQNAASTAPGGSLGIMNNNAGVPTGTFISGDSSAITPGAGPVILTPNWSLAAGTYWLVAVANLNSILNWDSTGSPPSFSALAFGDGTGSPGSWSAGGNQAMAMATMSSGTVPPVPLPATLPLFATGLGALGLLGWRRNRKPQAV